MVIFSVLPAALLGIALLIVAIHVIKNVTRSLSRGIVSLVVMLLALLISDPLAKLLAGQLSIPVVRAAMGALDEQMRQELEAMPALQESATALMQALLAPLLFLALYFVVRLLLSFFRGLLRHALEGVAHGTQARRPLFGALIGLVCGCVMTVAILTPTVGCLTLAHDVLYEMEVGGVLSEDSPIHSADMDATMHSPVFVAVDKLGGHALFKDLSTADLQGYALVLEDEVRYLASVVGQVMELSHTESFGEKELNTLGKLTGSFEKSALMRVCGAQLISGLSTAWSEDRAFMGMEKPQMDGMSAAVMDSVLETFKDTTPESIGEQMQEVTTVVEGVAELQTVVGNMTEGGSLEDIPTVLEEDATVQGIVEALSNATLPEGTTVDLTTADPIVLVDAVAEIVQLPAQEMEAEQISEQISAVVETLEIELPKESCDAIAQVLQQTPPSEDLVQLTTTLSTVANTLPKELSDMLSQLLSGQVPQP